MIRDRTVLFCTGVQNFTGVLKMLLLLGRWIDISIILFRLFRRLSQRMEYWTTNAKHDWSVRLRNEEISGSLYLVLKPSNQGRRRARKWGENSHRIRFPDWIKKDENTGNLLDRSNLDVVTPKVRKTHFENSLWTDLSYFPSLRYRYYFIVSDPSLRVLLTVNLAHCLL